MSADTRGPNEIWLGECLEVAEGREKNETLMVETPVNHAFLSIQLLVEFQEHTSGKFFIYYLQ